mgnify:CR=1 FL=1
MKKKGSRELCLRLVEGLAFDFIELLSELKMFVPSLDIFINKYQGALKIAPGARDPLNAHGDPGIE